MKKKPIQTLEMAAQFTNITFYSYILAHIFRSNATVKWFAIEAQGGTTCKKVVKGFTFCYRPKMVLLYSIEDVNSK